MVTIPMLDFRICNDDILKAWADIVALKYAERFHGADLAIATAVGFSAAVDEGQHIFVKGSNIDAREVLFVGVGPLGEFRYQKIRKFGQHVLETVARERPRAESLAMTMH